MIKTKRHVVFINIDSRSYRKQWYTIKWQLYTCPSTVNSKDPKSCIAYLWRITLVCVKQTVQTWSSWNEIRSDSLSVWYLCASWHAWRTHELARSLRRFSAKKVITLQCTKFHSILDDVWRQYWGIRQKSKIKIYANLYRAWNSVKCRVCLIFLTNFRSSHVNDKCFVFVRYIVYTSAV